MMLRLRSRLALVLVLAVLCILGTVGTVSAHALLKTADPADKAVLPAAPTQVILTFTEETSATMSTGAVTDASGTTVSTGFMVDLNQRTRMTIPLKPGLGAGVYTVKYHTLTEDDGGTVNDTTTFTVQGAAGVGAATVQPAAQVAATTAPITAPTATLVPTTAASTATRAATATTAPAATIAPTATRAGATATSAATVTRAVVTATVSSTATRVATVPIATGTGGGAALPATGNPQAPGAWSWLTLTLIGSGLLLVVGISLRRKAMRG